MSRNSNTIHFCQTCDQSLRDDSFLTEEDRSFSEPKEKILPSKSTRKRRSKSNSKIIRIIDKIKSGYSRAKLNVSSSNGQHPSYNKSLCERSIKVPTTSHIIKDYVIYGETTMDNCNSNWKIKSFEIESLIGKGTYGIVYKAKSSRGEYYAIKSLSYSKIKKNTLHLDKPFKSKEAFIHDLQKFIHLKHPNVLRLFSVLSEANDDTIYLLYELGTRPLMVVPSAETCTEIEALFYFRDILHGLKYLHEHNIAHLDLKPNNLILTADYRIKLADFGQSIIFDEDFFGFYAVTGSIGFCAPELLTKKDGHLEMLSLFISDIWSLGITLYCLIYGHIPWSYNSIGELIESIVSDTPSFPSTPMINPALYDLIGRMICKNPEYRIKLGEIQEHTWVTVGGTLKFKIGPNVDGVSK